MKLTLFILIFLSSACGKLDFLKKSSEAKPNPLKISGTLKANVFYEPGAEPYTDISGSLLSLPVSTIKVWNVLQENLKALYPGKNIVVPKSLSEMSAMSAKNKATWSYSEIKDLGDELGVASAGDTTELNIFFLNGRSTSNANAIGVHLSGTRTMAIFKEVVEQSGSSVFVKNYVEQATLVHEVGHAIGLVNNGIPLTSSHEDAAHRAHCKNPKCVMYWSNEGFNDMKDFIESRKDNPDLVMFDQACLQDVTSHKN